MKIVMDDQRHEREFEEIKENCPWRNKGVINPSCAVDKKKCNQDNCAPYHFKKYFEGRGK